jgi:hypothetical protein
MAYVLNGSPQYRAVAALQPGRPYPQAKSYARFFAGLREGNPERGWLKIVNPRDLKRGDIMAWEKQPVGYAKPGRRRGNSGHVMMVIDAPGEVEIEEVEGKPLRFLSVRVIDSSSVVHFPPEELPPLCAQNARDGLGIGYVRLVLDGGLKPIGYWEGTYWGEGRKAINHPSYSDTVAFARLVNID